MPRVNSLAQRGVIIDEMRAAAPWTYPSVLSLMSGLYPQQHGADGHLFENTLSEFDPEIPLLHEVLHEAGWSTAAFVANPFFLDWNDFHTGFDRFDGSFIGEGGHEGGQASVWARETMFGDSVNAAIRAHYDPRPVERSEFTYVHYIDVHGPWKGAPFSWTYEGATRFIDERIAELHAYMSERYGGKLLFFVTSDHGRELRDDLQIGEGPEWRKRKATIHEFNVRVPFAILPGEKVPEGRRISGPTSNVDFVPTVLDWLEMESPLPLPGRSLLPAILEGRELADDRPIYGRHSAFGTLTDGLVHEGRKYLRYFDATTGDLVRREVFDLAADPREAVPVGDEFEPVRELIRIEAGTRGVVFEKRFADVPADVQEKLRALGYLGGEP